MTASEQPALAFNAPWQMTLAEFSRAYKPARYFQHYTSEQRAIHAASHRLGYRQRTAVGEFYYVHPLRPTVAFPSASEARRITHRHVIKQALQQGLPVPAEVLNDHPLLL